MSFFGPISPPMLDEASDPLIRRALRQARIVGNFAFVQAAVQIIGFISGILLIRHLDQREYAYYTCWRISGSVLVLSLSVGASGTIGAGSASSSRQR
jgi:hypothetical protein